MCTGEGMRFSGRLVKRYDVDLVLIPGRGASDSCLFRISSALVLVYFHAFGSYHDLPKEL